jgi:hypothetical protein
VTIRLTPPPVPFITPESHPCVYIAGPVTGHADFNVPAFDAAAARLLARGFVVYNPADVGRAHGTDKPWDFYMRICLRQVTEAQAVAVLPGWSTSKGAQLEVHVARRLKMPIVWAEDLSSVDAAVWP